MLIVDQEEVAQSIEKENVFTCARFGKKPIVPKRINSSG